MTAEPSLLELGWARGMTDPAWIRRQVTAQRELLPTRQVWRGIHPPRALPAAPVDLDELPISLADGRTQQLCEVLAAAETDAIAVVHRGRLVYERYLHGCQPHHPHFNASASKSYLGLLAAILIRQGKLEREAEVADIVPELAGTAFGEATVDHLLHMGTLMSYAGRPYDKELEAQRFFALLAPRLRPQAHSTPNTILEHLATARPTGEPGSEFRYENGNVEALAEVLRRTTGTTISALMGELLWSRIGAEQDAYYVLDAAGAEAASGGFSATLRDVARLGDMLCHGGAAGGEQIVPERVVAGITEDVPEGPARRVRSVRTPNAQATMSYHDYWWLPNDPFGSFTANGIHGQRLFVSPALDLVVVHYGAHVMSPSVPVPPFIQTFLQIGIHLNDLPPIRP
jgi:CubicO group peptidase (beta-lactamase class C family)